MAFYGERFRHPDEEDVWEELKKIITNPPSEQEIALKKQEEQAKIDTALERMFPDLPKQQTEPYLNNKDLFKDKEQLFEGTAGMAAPIQESLASHIEWLEELKRKRKKLG